MAKKQNWGKLPPAFKAKWLAALRSGKYQQGKNQLLTIEGEKNTEHFCCLGLACRVVGASLADINNAEEGFIEKTIPSVKKCTQNLTR